MNGPDGHGSGAEPSRAWCWSRLAAFDEGLLTVETLRGRQALPVPYAVTHDRIVIPLAPTNTLGWRAAGSAAALVVTGGDDEGRWRIRATGRAERVRSDELDVRRPASVLERPRSRFDPPPHQLVLTSVSVHACTTSHDGVRATTDHPNRRPHPRKVPA